MLNVDISKCTGCEICELACSASKQGVFSLVSACLRVRSRYTPEGILLREVLVCDGCSACASACPTGAIRARGDWMAYDPSLCSGCGECISACPKGLVKSASRGGVVLCDGCGGNPACVRWCPKGALAVADGR